MAADRWNIDPAHSLVEFAVRHLMISTVKGRFADVAGYVIADEADPSGVKVDVTIKVASIDTRQPDRDAHLKSADFFDAEKYPDITFKGSHVEGDDMTEFVLHGNLTIHGVTKPVALNVTEEGRGKDPWGNERVGYSAKGKIDRRDFGLTWNQSLETGGIAVGHEVKLSIDLEVIKVPAGEPATAKA
jgi:polyisoprenoid-binding protein YceI